MTDAVRFGKRVPAMILAALLSVLLICSESEMYAQGGGTALSGSVIEDVDGNGKRDGDDRPLAGWTVRLIDSATGKVLDQVKTSGEGRYVFENPVAGRPLQVSVEVEEEWVQTVPALSLVPVTAIQGRMVIVEDILFNTDLLVFPFDRPCGTPFWTTECTDTILIAGTDDNFVAGNSEPTSPGSDLLQWMGNSVSFDFTGVNRRFGHTFVLPRDFVPGRCVVRSARLTIRLKANGSTSMSSSGNDGLTIMEGANGTASSVWGSSLGSLHGSSWGNGTTMTLTLDLASMPQSSSPNFPAGMNILNALQDGDLDIYVQDDTGIDFMRLEVTYCCRVQGECDCVQKPSLDTACCGYRFSLVNNVGTPITGMSYVVYGGTVSGVSQTPCPFTWIPAGPTNGSLAFNPGCNTSPITMEFDVTPTPNNSTGWITIVLHTVHADGRRCRIVQRFRCRRAPKSRCDSLRWSFYSFDPNNISGRVFTVQNTKLPASPITHIDVKFTPSQRPLDGQPLVVNGGLLKVNGIPAGSTWGPQPFYGQRIPNPVQTLVPSATSSVSFWLGIDRLQGWSGTVEFTVWHADGDSCILRTSWHAGKKDIDIADLGTLRVPVASSRRLVATTFRTPVDFEEGVLSYLSLEPLDQGDGIFAVPGSSLRTVDDLERRDRPAIEGVTSKENIVFVEFDVPFRNGEGGPDDSLDLPLVIEVDSGKTTAALRLTYYGPDGEPYGFREIIVDGSNSSTVERLTDVPTAIRTGGNVEQLELFPNPAGDRVTAEFTLAGRDDVVIELFDPTGELMLERNLGRLENGMHRVLLDVSLLPSGVYFLKVKGVQGSFTQVVTIHR